MICVRRQWRRAGRQKNIPSRVRLNDVAETGPGFGKTFVNDRVIDHPDGTHGYLPWRRFDVSAVPLVVETAFDSIAQRFLPCEPAHYRNSSANCRAVSPPLGMGSTPQLPPSARRILT